MEDKMFDLITKIYNEMQDMKAELKSEIKDIKTTMATKQDIARLENTLGDKIDALFDAREVQLDKDIEVSTNIKRVENKVDRLEFKVLKNALRKTE